VEISHLKDGRHGISIGQEDLWLSVKLDDFSGYFILYDMHGGMKQICQSIKARSPMELISSKNSEEFRKTFEKRYGSNWMKILLRIVSIILNFTDEQANQMDKVSEEKNNRFDMMIDDEAEEILNSKEPMKIIAKHLDNIIAGESDNKKIVFRLLLSGMNPDPESKQIIILKGESGAGKSKLMKLADFFKVKDVGRFTAHALDYADLKDYDILRIKELGNMDKEDQGLSTLKFLSSDDKGYTVEVTIKDEKTHKFTTKQYRIPPITVITSTTRVILDPQLERRAVIINLDESKEQTKKVLDFKTKMIEEKNFINLGLRTETNEEHSIKVLQCLVNKIMPVKVIIPFPKILQDVFAKPILRARGDYDKIYNLVMLESFLQQRTLIQSKINYSTVVFARPDSAAQVLSEAKASLIGMLMDLERRSRNLIEHLEEIGIKNKDDLIDMEKRREISKRIGRSVDTITKYLNEWVSSGYASSEFQTGRTKVYRLLYSIEEIRNKEAGISRILETPDILTAKMTKEALKSQKEILEKQELSPELRACMEKYCLKLKDILSSIDKDPHKVEIERNSAMICQIKPNQTAITKFGISPNKLDYHIKPTVSMQNNIK
jgi:hypothetical protein